MVRRTPAETPEQKIEREAQAATVKDGIGSNSGVNMQLYSFVERIERLSEEHRALREDITEVFGEAKGQGFDTKILRMAIRRRAMDAGDRKEMDSMLELYEEAIGTAAKSSRD